MRSRILVYRELQFVLSHCPLHYVSPYSAAEQYNYGRLVPVALALHLSSLTSIILHSTIIPNPPSRFQRLRTSIRHPPISILHPSSSNATRHQATSLSRYAHGVDRHLSFSWPLAPPSPLPYICTYSFTHLFLVHGFCITYGARRYAALKDFHIHK